jgi:uncharacterized membrane protein YfcA
MNRFTEKLPLVVIATVGGMVLSLGTSILLHNAVPDPLRQGIAFWVLMVSLYPLMVYLSQREKHRNTTPPKFRRHLIVATAGAIVFGLLSTLFGL